MSAHTFGFGRGVLSEVTEIRIHRIATEHNVRFVYADTGDANNDSKFWFEINRGSEPPEPGDAISAAAATFKAALRADTALYIALRQESDLLDFDEVACPAFILK